MANLTAVFELVDKISDKLDSIANKGSDAVDKFEAMGDAADQSFSDATSAANGVVSAVSSYSQAASKAAAQTDYWTDAVGNYDKSCLEAVYSTEELVEMGMKSADALKEQEEMFDLCEREAKHLNEAMEASGNISKELSDTIDKSSKAIEELTDNEKVSADTKDKLKTAADNAAQAMDELTAAQEQAEQAMQHYDSVMQSGTNNLEELEAAAEQACHAAENLAEANGKASTATKELSDATEQASQEAENGGDTGTAAIEGIASALAAAGITATIKEIAASVYDMADSFTEAEKIIVASSGATGQELEQLTQTAQNVFAKTNAESVQEIASGMSLVATNTNLTGEALEEATTKGYELQDLMGFDMQESSRTASALMKNFGITASEAYDIITVGAQNGANKNGDLLDILNEYSAQYAALGLSANEFVSSLVSGADAGVFSIDKVGDAVKEFNIRAKDGSDTSAAAFELLGMNADIMTEKFAAGGDTASEAFFQVVNALEAMDDPVQKNAAAVGLFGTMYEDLESNLLPILSNIEGGTLDTAGALDTAADSAQSMSDKWTKAGNNIKTAFANAITPTLSKVSGGLADIANSIGDFLNEHPVVVKAITAIGVGLGTVAVGVAGVAAASLTAIPAVASLATAINAAIWPLTAVAAGIAAVTAAVLIFKGHYDDVYEEARSVTPVMAEQQDELANLEAEYEKACETYGETSEEASRLKYQIDDLSAEIEANGQSMDEWCAEMDAVIQSHDDLMAELDSTNEELENSSLKNLSLIQKLEDLATQTDTTSESQQAMQAILSELNGTIDGLNVSYDDLTENTDSAIKSIREAAKAQAEQERQQALMDEYVDLIAQQADEQEALAEATDQVTAAEKQANEATRALSESHKDAQGHLSGWKMFWSFLSDEQAANDAAQDTLNDATSRAEELQSALDETDARIQEIEDEWAGVGDAAEGAAETTVTYEDACSTALSDVKDRVDELCASYDQAYQSALSSFEGQFGLFDEASTKSDEYLNASVENAQKALDSQLSYWETYNANLETLTSYGEGLTGEARENYETLLTYAQDGSEEAAGLAASMAEAISSGDEEAIQKLSETVGAVKEQQEEAAAATAEWQTNFNETLDGIVSDMSAKIGEMGFEDEANQAALDTMTSYASGIKAGSNEAITEVEAVASQITTALEKSDVKAKIEAELDTSAVDKYEMPDKTATAEYELDSKTVDDYQPEDKSADAVYEVDDSEVRSYDPPDKSATVTYTVKTSGTVPGHASGTTYAENMFIAGENGPELIVGQQGSTVFPHSETEQIIDAMSKQNEAVTVVNEYEPTGFMDKLESAFSKLTGKMTAVFEKLGGIAPTVELEGYASGTTASEDSFIAGENGPELIVSKPDSTVFPADETDRIVNAIGRSSISVGNAGEQDGGIFVPTGNDNGLMEDSGRDSSASTRKILLEIAGKGNIELSGGKVDKETMLSFLYEYLKPVLSEILTQEIYEEGDMAYEY